MSESLPERLERYRREVEQERGRFWSDWLDIDTFLYPRSQSRLLNLSGQSRATRRSDDKVLVNETACFAHGVLRSGLMAGYTNPSRPWFKLTLTDSDLADYYTAKSWLAEVEERLRSVLLKANFYHVLPHVYGDCAAFGATALVCLDDPDHGVRFTCCPAGSYSVGLDDTGRPVVLYRTLELTVRQVLARWGADAVSSRVKTKADKGQMEEPVTVIHAIIPNDRTMQSVMSGGEWERGADGRLRKAMPFRSIQYELHGGDQMQVLAESGFEEFPAAFPRWDAIDGETYSTRWPGLTSLASVKQLQATERIKFTVHDHQARPAMIADASMKLQKTSIVPGGITYIDGLSMSGRPGYQRAFDVNPSTVGMQGDVQGLELRIKRAFHEDLMTMFATGDYRQMTAREVAERSQEKIFVLGPVMQHFDTELLDPILFRTLSVLYRNGLLPPAPPELQGQELKLEYVSIMSQALRMIGASSTETFVAGVSNLAQVFGPQVLDNIDADHVVTEYAEQQGVSPKILIPEDEVKKRREARAQQQQAAALEQQRQQAGTRTTPQPPPESGGGAGMAAMMSAMGAMGA